MVGGEGILWLPNSANPTNVGFVLRIRQSNVPYIFFPNALLWQVSGRSYLITPIPHNILGNNLCVRSLKLPFMARSKNWLREQIKIPMFTRRNRHCPRQWFSGVMALGPPLELIVLGNSIVYARSSERGREKKLERANRQSIPYREHHKVSSSSFIIRERCKKKGGGVLQKDPVVHFLFFCCWQNTGIFLK